MPGPELSLLMTAAEEAGEIALRHFRNRPKVWDKADEAGPVTEADLEVDAFLKQALTEARPAAGWLSEETEDDPARLSAAEVFIVDPIDGTRAYIDGARDWALSLALVQGGVPVAAVVHMPAQEQSYSAEAGGGAFLNGTRLAMETRAALQGATVLANKHAFAEHRWPQGLPPVTRHFRSSLAYRMSLVAEGRFDAMVTLRPAWHWDIAAGALIVAEAGGTVSDHTGTALLFNTPDPRSPAVVAGERTTHSGLIAAGPS